MRRILWVLAAALTIAPAAHAQTADGRARARAVLPAEVFDQLDRVVTEAGQAGLPVEPLWDKVLEGAAKGVPAPRIAPAVTDYVARLRAARGALGPAQPPAALVAGADARRRGVPATALTGVAEGGRAATALVVLADLVETGVPVDRAVDVVREALARRSADEELMALTGRVRAAMREGQSAGTAAEGVRRQIRDGRGRVPPTREPAAPPAPPGSEPTRDPGTPTRPRGG